MATCKNQSARGRFREPIEVQESSKVQDATLKSFVYSWETIIETRAEVQDAGGLRNIWSDRLEPEVTHIMTVRNNNDIVRDNRIMWSGREFRIIKLVRIPFKSGRGSELQMHLEEVDGRV